MDLALGDPVAPLEREPGCDAGEVLLSADRRLKRRPVAQQEGFQRLAEVVDGVRGNAIGVQVAASRALSAY